VDHCLVARGIPQVDAFRLKDLQAGVPKVERGVCKDLQSLEAGEVCASGARAVKGPSPCFRRRWAWKSLIGWMA